MSYIGLLLEALNQNDSEKSHLDITYITNNNKKTPKINIKTELNQVN